MVSSYLLIKAQIYTDTTPNITTIPTREITVSPSTELTVTPSKTTNSVIKKTLTYSRENEEFHLNLESIGSTDTTTRDEIEKYSSHFIVQNQNMKIDIEYNPYDLGGYNTVNDTDFVQIKNKLNKYILRPSVLDEFFTIYNYAEFYQGKCIQEQQTLITPLPGDLYCGYPWLTIENPDENIQEYVVVNCTSENQEGLNQCDQFVENLEIEITKEEL